MNRRKTAWRLAVADDIDFGEGIAFSKSDYSHAALSISPLFCGHYLSIANLNGDSQAPTMGVLSRSALCAALLL